MESVTERYANGETVASIAKHYKMTREGIYLHLRKDPDFEVIKERNRDLRDKTRSKKNNEMIADIIKRVLRGEHQRNIAKELNIQPVKIYKLLTIAGTNYQKLVELKRENIVKEFEDITQEMIASGGRSNKRKAIKMLAEKYDHSVSYLARIVYRML